MIFFDEYLRGVRETNKLGFPASNPQFIPQKYLDDRFFIIWRTCHTFGDWQIVSAMPRLIKKKYPDCTIAIPSPTCLHTKYDERNWQRKHDKPFNNVIEVYSNNPYVDGMIDEIPDGMPLFHDHFRIYDENEPNVPLTEEMLKFWRFDPKTITDSSPELYWSNDEVKESNDVINKIFGNDPFGFLYIDDSTFETAPDTDPSIGDPLKMRRYKIQQKINEFDNLPWLYYAGKDISETYYKTKTKSVDVRSLKVSLRVQSYIKSKSKLIIGHQGGYGTDCMSRYTTCYVVPLTYKTINEHYIRSTKYIMP